MNNHATHPMRDGRKSFARCFIAAAILAALSLGGYAAAQAVEREEPQSVTLTDPNLVQQAKPAAPNAPGAGPAPMVTPPPVPAPAVAEPKRPPEELLAKGNLDAALEAYRNKLVDDPESADALFGIGCTLYRQGERAMAAEGPSPQAPELFNEAGKNFQKVVNSTEDGLRGDAAYNRANCLAQVAKATIGNPEQYQQSVAAARRAIDAFEAVVKDYPDNAAARQNLDHMRYELKKLLQNPPEDQEKKDENDENQPKAVSVFTSASTELPNASATMLGEGDIVELTQEKGAKP